MSPKQGSHQKYTLLFICHIILFAVIDGELTIVGLSSSSTLVITFINALAYINNKINGSYYCKYHNDIV